MKKSLLPVTFTGLVPSTTALWGHYVSGLDGPLTKYLLLIFRGPWFEFWVCSLIFFHADILGRLGSNLVFIVPFGITFL